MSDAQVRCVELVELVTEWMEGALDDGTRAGVEEHLVVCSPCSTYVTQLRGAIDATRRVGMDPPPPGTREGLLRAFRDEHGA